MHAAGGEFADRRGGEATGIRTVSAADDWWDPRRGRETDVGWCRCIRYPSGGSRYQWRQPHAIAW